MTEIQKKMFAEMHDKKIFEHAFHFGKQYADTIPERNVYPTTQALENLKNFEEPMPDNSADSFEVIDKLNQYGSPATVAQTGGRYFGFVCGGVVPTGLAAKILDSFWDQNTGMYVISPITATLEQVSENWLKNLFNLPDETVAGFVSGTTTANLCGLAAARYRILLNQGWDVNKKGFRNAPQIKIIAGKDAHSSMIKSINLLGFGTENVFFVDADDQGRIVTENVPELDKNTLLILQAGNVNSGAFDDFNTLCLKAKQAGAWVHIDGAFGLWAAASKRLSYLTKGIELANSWAVDGHKTLNTPYDNGIILCSDKDALVGALQMTGGYLVLGNERDGLFYTLEMSRRARAVELWATLKYLGKSGVEDLINGLHERAKQFAEELSAMDGFTVLNDIVFNQVLVSCTTEEITMEVLKNIQQERVCWAGGSTWKGKKVIRISVCSWTTTKKDISLSAESFRSSLLKAGY